MSTPYQHQEEIVLHKYDSIEFKREDIKDFEEMVNTKFPDKTTYTLECDAEKFHIKGTAAKKVAEFMNGTIAEVLKCDYPSTWEERFKLVDQSED